MSLRIKTLLVIGLVFSILFGVAFATSRAIYLKRFANLEQHMVVDALDRLNAQMKRELDDLSSSAADWAVFDAAYEFGFYQ